MRHGRATIALVALLVALLLALPRPLWAKCSAEGVDIRGPWGQAHFNVEVADDARARAIGLMNRDRMSPSAGMLFIYPAPRSVAFWMKNTLIPLDMLFLDKTGRVVRIHQNAQPMNETPIPGGENIKAVLEINGGMVRALGIGEGSELRHPAFAAAAAAWPCD